MLILTFCKQALLRILHSADKANDLLQFFLARTLEMPTCLALDQSALTYRLSLIFLFLCNYSSAVDPVLGHSWLVVRPLM